MKILLAYISGVPDRHDPYISLLPTGLCSLQACLRQAGYDAVLANYSGWSDVEIRRSIAELNPDIAGVSQWTHNRHASLLLAKIVRNTAPGCLLVMGGAHATCCYPEILGSEAAVDCIVLGEGEDTLLELAGCVKNGREWSDVRGIAFRRQDGDVVTTPPRPPLADLDSLPFAVSCLDHSVGVDVQLQAEFILTSRGCPSACHFCSSPKIWKRKVRFRSPARIVEEMMYLRDRFGLIYFSLRDDTFTADRARTLEFCRMLVERRAYLLWNCQSRVTALDEELLVWMKRAGCECVQLGVESGSPRILSQLGKTITPEQVETAAGLVRKVGINLSVYLISDVPGESEEDLSRTLDLIRRIHPDDGYVSPLAYFPGTRLFDDAVAEGLADRNVFMSNPHPAVFAAGEPGKNSRRLLRCLERSALRSAERFRPQKGLLEYCYATNVLVGECHRQQGGYGAAEREFREITEREPDNPWGWFLLGELYAESGKGGLAQECYRAVCRIVPEHAPSRQALQAKKKRGHDSPAPY